VHAETIKSIEGLSDCTVVSTKNRTTSKAAQAKLTTFLNALIVSNGKRLTREIADHTSRCGGS